jgi:hypothetical protein
MPQTSSTGFSVLPYALLDALGEHKNIGWLYLWLHRHGNGSEEGAWASVATLARECHMHRDAVKAGLRWLVDQGWVERVKRPGRSSSYLLRLQDPGRPSSTCPPDRGQPPSKGQPPYEGQPTWTATEGQPPNKGQHLAPKRGPAPNRDPAPKQGPTPGPHLGATNKNPGTRTQQQPKTSSCNSLVSFFLSEGAGDPKKGGEGGWAEEQPAAAQPSAALKNPPEPTPAPPQAQPIDYEATPPLQIDPAWTPEQRRAAVAMFLPPDLEALEAAYDGPAGAPGDPGWLRVRAYPDSSWGGPYAPKPPPEPAAVAPRLPVPVADLPAALQPIADRIEAYWLDKAGSRSLPAFEALVEELELILPKAGRSGVQELLRHASQAGWPVINGRTWLAHRNREPDLTNPPAYRTFPAA